MIIVPEKSSFNGIISLPGDKSIAHRALIHAALANGDSHIMNLPCSRDVSATINALKSLKVPIRNLSNNEIIVMGGGGEFAPPDKEVSCGNSGTTMRLLTGLLASCPFESKLVGDESLSRRPMERVAEPLRMMGAIINTTDGFPPVSVEGKVPLTPIKYKLPIPSAQLKSALIYAAMFADGESIIEEPIRSRDHTEIALKILCPSHYKRDSVGGSVTHHIKGQLEIPSFECNIPGDPSSGAYLAALALLTQDSEIILKGLLLNPCRIRYLEILKMMGGDIEIVHRGYELGERVGDVVVRTSRMKNIEIHNDDIPLIIDEIPILAAIASKCDGVFTVRGAGELRHKESDRISSIVRNLGGFGCDIEEYPDGFSIKGGAGLSKGDVDCQGDHRILMSLIVLSIIHDLKLEFGDLSSLAVSFPEFVDYIRLLKA